MNNTVTDKPLTPDEILIGWRNAKTELAKAIVEERKFRDLAVATFFPNAVEGTNNFELGNGYVLKATIKYNYSLGKRDEVNDMLDELSKVGNDGEFVAERIVNWSPSLSVKEYRELSDAHKKIVDGQLTIKPAAPTLEIVEPKT